MPDKKISELDIASTVNGDDVSILVRNGTDHQYAFTRLLSYLSANIATGNQLSFVPAKPQDLYGKDQDVAVNTLTGVFYQKRSGTWVDAYTFPINNTPAGNTIIYDLGMPSASIGALNDTYIDTANGKFYKKTTDGWQQEFSMLNGPAGGPGPKGDQGVPGINGKSVLSGPVNPSNQTVGTNGDFYINTNAYTLFGPKANDDWGPGLYMIPSLDLTGNLNDLNTDTKSNLVAAINEVLNGLTNIDLSVPAWKVYGNVPFGKYANLATVPGATSAFLQYKEAFQNVNPPPYTQPVVSTPTVTARLAGTSTLQNTSTIEVGQVLDLTIDPSITLNDSTGLADGPAPKPLSITKNGVEIGTTDPTTDSNVTTTSALIVYTSMYNYKGANIKNNDAGEPDNRGQFGAGSKSASLTITPRYRVFYGSIPSSIGLTSDLLRGLSGGGTVTSVFEAATQPLISLNTGTTNRRFFVAVRANSGKTLTVAKDVQTNGDVRSIYLSGKVTMNIKNGGTGDVSYDVYVYEQAVAYGEAHTHELTLA